jgi:hypothetical protein
MKRMVLGVAVMAVAVAVGASGSASGASSGFSCKIKLFKVDGRYPAVTGCGPATAELTVAGKTHTFKNGVCALTGTGSSRELSILLGTTVSPATNANYGYSTISIGVIGTQAIVVAQFDGKSMTGVQGLGIVPVKLTGKYTGTFVAHRTVKISGSWNCNGVITTA